MSAIAVIAIALLVFGVLALIFKPPGTCKRDCHQGRDCNGECLIGRKK